MNNPGYDEDFAAWTRAQARMLQAGRFEELDITHLIEEIEDLGASERRALESRLGVLLGHLLKWKYQPDYPHRKSWRATIREQRRQIQRLLARNPSLESTLNEAVADGYQTGVNIVVAETPLDDGDLPRTCPFTVEQILAADYWPDG